MATSEADVAAKLIERLLMDPAFRVRFRRNPAEACREAGLEELAQEMSIGGGKAMMTLDMRESKSSLAGVMMAAAMEGVGVMQFVEHVAPHLDDIPEAIGDVLSRVNLPAIGGALAPSPPPSAPAAPAARARTARTRPAAASTRASTPPWPATAPRRPPPLPPRWPPASPSRPARPRRPPRPTARPGRRSPRRPRRPSRRRPAEQAAEKIAQAEDPKTKTAEAGQKAAADIAENAKDLPSATDLPDGKSAPQAAVDVGGEPKAAGEPAAAAAPAAARWRPRWPPRPADPNAAARRRAARRPAADAPAAAPRGAIDPDRSSGRPAAAARCRRRQPRCSRTRTSSSTPTGSPTSRRARSTRASSRLLTKLSERAQDQDLVHVLGPLQVHGGRLDLQPRDRPRARHRLGRRRDRQPGLGRVARARQRARRSCRRSYRPDEIGSPWPIAGPATSPTPRHQDHLHVGFKTGDRRELDAARRRRRPGRRGPPPLAAPSPQRPALRPVAAAAPVAAAPAARGGGRGRRAARAEAGRVGPFLAAKADAGREGGLRRLHGGQARRARRAALAPPGTVRRRGRRRRRRGAGGRARSSLGATALETAETQLGVKRGGRANPGAKVDEYLRPRRRRARQPVVRELRHLVARADRPQDGGRRLGRRADVGPQRRGGQERPPDRQRRGTPGRATSSPTTGAGRRTSAPTGTSASSRASVKDGKFTALEGNNQDAVMNVPRRHERRQRQVHPRRRRRAARDAAAGPARAGRGGPDPAAAVRGGRRRGGSRRRGGRGANPYPGDDAPKEEIAAWMGREAEKRGLPKQLPVMAALVESGVKNLDYGDADFVGYFQMRSSDLEQGRLRGLPREARAAGEVVPRPGRAGQEAARLAAGRPITDPNQFGEWIADVERPAEQYRGRYGMRLAEANGLLGQASAAPAPAAAAAAAPTPGAPVAAAAAVAPPEPKAGRVGRVPGRRRRTPRARRRPRARSWPSSPSGPRARWRRPERSPPRSTPSPPRRRGRARAASARRP